MERLRTAGIDREIALVPDPAILLPRLFPPAMLARRLEALRSDGSYPSAERVLAVQGSRAHLPYLAELAGKGGELDRLMATRTFRYTAALRRLYGRLRHRPR